MLKVKPGDLLEATEDIICHQVNCYGEVGGLAYHVFRKWPDAGNDYQQLVKRIRSAGIDNRALLGMAQMTGMQPDGHIIMNLYGQLYAGEDYRPESLRAALETVSIQARLMGKSVALPWKISCGICGGDWKEVEQIIKETMRGVKRCTIYRREGDE